MVWRRKRENFHVLIWAFSFAESSNFKERSPLLRKGMWIYMAKMCVLEERVCTNCGECNLCDLDKNKVCDSCGKCIQMPEAEYYEIKIDEIMNTEEK